MNITWYTIDSNSLFLCQVIGTAPRNALWELHHDPCLKCISKRGSWKCHKFFHNTVSYLSAQKQPSGVSTRPRCSGIILVIFFLCFTFVVMNVWAAGPQRTPTAKLKKWLKPMLSRHSNDTHAACWFLSPTNFWEILRSLENRLLIAITLQQLQLHQELSLMGNGYFLNSEICFLILNHHVHHNFTRSTCATFPKFLMMSTNGFYAHKRISIYLLPLWLYLQNLNKVKDQWVSDLFSSV